MDQVEKNAMERKGTPVTLLGLGLAVLPVLAAARMGTWETLDGGNGEMVITRSQVRRQRRSMEASRRESKRKGVESRTDVNSEEEKKKTIQELERRNRGKTRGT